MLLLCLSQFSFAQHFWSVQCFTIKHNAQNASIQNSIGVTHYFSYATVHLNVYDYCTCIIIKRHLYTYMYLLFCSRSTNNPNVANAKRVADLYAEVIGVVSQVRFLSVRMRFFGELKNPQNSSSVIISVIEGLSFVRIKMYPVEELEEWFSFLQVHQYIPYIQCIHVYV